MNTDDRGQWTSASAAQADSLCPGRHLAQRGIPEPPPTEDAASGTRIHAWLEGKETKPLTDEELDIAAKCKEIEREVTSRVFDKVDWAKSSSHIEERLWLEFDGLKHSGKPDVVHIYGQAAICLDWKTGRNEAPDSPRNLQLRDLAVLVAVNYGVSKVHVAIIQPWVTMTPEVCTYELEDLLAAKEALKNRVWVSNAHDAPRIPGEVQCQYCRAKRTCPEFAAQSLPVQAEKVTPESITWSIKTMEPERLGAFLPLVRLAAEAAEKEVRARLESSLAVPGWELKPGRTTEKIVDAQTVFTRALQMGVTQEQFVKDCVNVLKTPLKSILKVATGAKGKELDAAMASLLEGTTETKTSEPILSKA